MSGRYLVLADNTTYDGGECGYAEGVLWCYLPPGTDMKQAFLDFSDTTKTERIVFHYGEMQSEYEHFTDMRLCMIDYDGQVKIQLMKGSD